MSTDINTSTSNVSTSTLNAPTLVKRFGLIAMIAVLALLMGGKFSNALSSSPSVGGSSHSSFAGYGYGYGTTAPTGVSNVTVTAGTTAGSVKVSWTNPAANGATVTSYTVTNPDGNIVLCTQSVVGTALAANSCTWTPTSSNYYAGTVDVYANYATGAVIDTTGNAAIQTLTAPTGTPTVTLGAGTVKVTFSPSTAAADGTASYTLGATGFAVYNGSTQVCVAASTATTCTFTLSSAGLTPGGAYAFTVKAINAGGYSLSSSPTASTTVVNAPNAPTNVTATVSYATGTLNVAFSAPSFNGGSALAAYAYYLNGVGSAVTCTATATSTTANPVCTIPLTNVATSGSTFTGFLTVVAANQTATATSSANSNTFTANAVPAGAGAVDLSITGSTATSATASWTAPADTASPNPILGYNVQLETCSSATVATATCTASGSPVYVAGRTTLSYGFTGLAYGKIYSVAVTAVNGSGPGAVSSIENEADGSSHAFYNLAAGAAPTAATTPVSITSFGNGTLTATFAAPSSLNGSTVTGYKLQLVSCTAMDTSCPVGAAKTATAAGTVTWTGLVPNAYYAVILTTSYLRTDGTTTGTLSSTSTTKLIGAAPAAFTITPSATGATFSWTAAAASNPVSSFTVAAGSTVICTATGSASSCTATTAQLAALILLSNTSITAYSTDANGINSATATPVTIAQIGAPTQSSIKAYGDTDASFTSGTDSVDLSWSAVTGALSYNVIAIGSDGTTVTAVTTGTDYVFPASALTAKSYTYQVSTNGSYGSSAYSTAVAYAGAASAPVTPAVVTAVNNADSTTPSLAYTAGAQSAGAALTLAALTPTSVANGGVLAFAFVVNLTSVGNPVQSLVGTLTVNSTTTETCTVPVASLTALGAYYTGICTFFGVKTGANYTFSVVAKGALVDSAAASVKVLNSAASGPVTALKASDASGGSGAAGTAGTLTKISWTAPALTASTLVGYNVTVLNKYGLAIPCYSTYNGSGATDMTTSTQAYCYFTSAAGSTYSISVVAIENVTAAATGYTALSGSILTDAATLSYSTYDVPVEPATPVASLFVYSGVSQGVSVTWAANPADVLGVTGYKVTVSAGTLSSCSTPNLNTVSGTTTVTITKTNGVLDTTLNCISSGVVPVQFFVQATNANGDSEYSAWSNAVTPVAVPAAAPTNVNYNANATTAGGTLYWTASAATTSYQIVVLNASTTQVVATYTVAAPATSYVIPATGLIFGTSYSIKMYSINAGGTYATPSSAAGVSAVPSDPTVWLTRSASTATTATLNWTAGASTGGPVTYSVYQTVNGLTTIVASGLTTTSYVLSAYAPSTTTYAVAEINAVGANTSGPIPVTANNTYTGVSVPVGATAYSAGTAVVSSTSVTVGATVATTDTGLLGDGSTRLPFSVVVTLTPAGGTAITATAAMCSGTTNITCTFTGLTPNTVYSYSVSEVSAIGSQLVPVTGYLVTKATAPGAPTISSVTKSVVTSAVTGSPVYSVTVTWAAPANAGTSAITGYTASVTPAGGSAQYCASVLTASSTSCTFTGLTAATVYGFSVAALNAAGSGTAATSIADATTADWTSTVTTANAGRAPAAVVAPLGNSGLVLTYPALGSITATWANYNASSPTNLTLAYPITSFICTATYAGVTTTVTAPATATSCTFTGLLNKAYAISVVAQNGYGVLATDGQSTALTATSKAQVSNSPALFGAASVVSGTITVQWQAPVTSTADSALGGANASALVSYAVTATDALGNVAGTCTAAATATTCTITGLKNSTTYDVVVTPTNAVGASSVVQHLSVKTISATAPAAPAIVSAVRNATGLAVTWTAPATVGSGQLVGYWVSATDPLSGQQYTCPYNSTYGLVLAPAVTCSINGLSVGSSYNISITAITKDGAGAVQTSAAGTKTGVVYNTLAPEPVMATFLAVTAKQKSVSALSSGAKTSLASLISSINDGAQITITGYGTTKAIALARANAAANYLFNNGAAVHVTIKSVISKTIKTALVTVTSN